MKKIIVVLCVISVMLMSSGIAMDVLPKDELSSISMVEGNVLITEFWNNRTMEVDIAGNLVWEKTGMTLPHDAERLPNGNTLITDYGDQIVIEVDSGGNIVWQKTGLNMPMDAERLSNGNTLITEYGGDRVIEVNNAGNIVWNKSGLNDPFDAERLSNGNTLIAETPMPTGRVIEVDIAGDIVWEKTGLSAPVDVERLSNGNTLITEHVGKSVIEIDGDGILVWAKTGLHVPKDAERLPNGNTLIADCGADRVVEIDIAGNEIWNKSGLFYPTDVENLFNYPPDKPVIEGLANGNPKTEYEYIFNAVDGNGDDVYYYIDWGDGNIEDWIGPYASGADVSVNHTWEKRGTYNITAKAKDVFGAEGPEGSLEVSMPKSKQFNLYLLNWLFDRFPNIFPFVRYFLGF
jgi:hypothetical protein